MLLCYSFQKNNFLTGVYYIIIHYCITVYYIVIHYSTTPLLLYSEYKLYQTTITTCSQSRVLYSCDTEQVSCSSFVRQYNWMKFTMFPFKNRTPIPGWWLLLSAAPLLPASAPLTLAQPESSHETHQHKVFEMNKKKKQLFLALMTTNLNSKDFVFVIVLDL